MLPSPFQIDLIRYLIVLRVNSSLVWLPSMLAAEISLVLGTTIFNRLPHSQAIPWQKTMADWDACGGISMIANKNLNDIPDTHWPINAVIFVYPNGKRSLGKDELILFELKLFGESASHDYFLEIILPALEEAGKTIDSRLQSLKTLWGHFDIQAAYAANGKKWRQFVTDGKLDLKYRPAANQWERNLNFQPKKNQTFDIIDWLTPFISEDSFDREKTVIYLSDLMDPFISRMSIIYHGYSSLFSKFFENIKEEDQISLLKAIDDSLSIRVHRNNFKEVPRLWPGRWTGQQMFNAFIPDSIFPYLKLASIIHVGRYSHFGCGTFLLKTSKDN